MNDIDDNNLYKLKFMIKQSNYIPDIFDKIKPTRDAGDEERVSLIDYGIKYPNNLFINILLEIVKPRLTFIYWMKMFELGLYRGRINFFNILDEEYDIEMLIKHEPRALFHLFAKRDNFIERMQISDIIFNRYPHVINLQ